MLFFLSVHDKGVVAVVSADGCFVLVCMLFVETSGGLTNVGYDLLHTLQGEE